MPASGIASWRPAWTCGRHSPTASTIGPPNCRIVYDKFHVLQHAHEAIDEVRRAEFFRKGGRMRGVVKGKRWLLLTRWMNLAAQGAAHGGDHERIHRSSESSLKCGSLRILVQNRKAGRSRRPALRSYSTKWKSRVLGNISTPDAFLHDQPEHPSAEAAHPQTSGSTSPNRAADEKA